MVAYKLGMRPRIDQRLLPDLDEKCRMRKRESREKGPRTLNFYVVSYALEKLKSSSGRAGDFKIDLLPHSLGNTGNKTQCKGDDEPCQSCATI